MPKLISLVQNDNMALSPHPYPMDKMIDDFHLSDSTRASMYRHFSGNGYDPLFFLLAENVSITDFGKFIVGCRHAAQKLKGDELYSTIRLSEMGIAYPSDARGRKMSGDEILAYLDSVTRDLGRTLETGGLCNTYSTYVITALFLGDGKKPRPGRVGPGPETHGMPSAPETRRARRKPQDHCRLSPPELERDWDLYVSTRDEGARNRLMEHYRDLVRYAAERLIQKLPANVELDDLISAGMFGLMDALDGFDPSRGFKFETYCAQRIKGAILDELRSMDYIPRLVRSRAKEVAKAREGFYKRSGYIPDENELAGEMNLTPDDFQRMMDDSNPKGIIFADNERDGGNSSPEDYYDSIRNKKAVDPPVEAGRRDARKHLGEGLDRDERLILALYYHEGMTMKEAGRVIGMSEGRVSQKHTTIIKRFRARMRERMTENLLP